MDSMCCAVSRWAWPAWPCHVYYFLMVLSRSGVGGWQVGTVCTVQVRDLLAAVRAAVSTLELCEGLCCCGAEPYLSQGVIAPDAVPLADLLANSLQWVLTFACNDRSVRDMWQALPLGTTNIVAGVEM